MEEKIALIGAGKMGSALLRGLLKKGGIPPSRFIVCDLKEERLAPLASEGIKISLSPEEAVREAKIVIIAVKPQDIESLLSSLSKKVKENTLLISLCAGITTSWLREKVKRAGGIVRVMPNTPVSVGEGVSCLSLERRGKREWLEKAKKIFQKVGETVEVEEELMEGITALSGSGPAFIFQLMESLKEGGVLSGLPEKLAEKLVLQTTRGAATLAKETGKDLKELTGEVVSPGGTTARGLAIFKKRNLREALIEMVVEAARRARELKK